MASASTLLAMKAHQEAKSIIEQKAIDRRRSILVLIMQHLVICGYNETASALSKEVGGNLNQFEPADNMDLSTIFTDFESAYYARLGKNPKFYRRIEADCSTSASGMDKRADENRSLSSSTSSAAKRRINRRCVQKEALDDMIKFSESTIANIGLEQSDIGINGCSIKPGLHTESKVHTGTNTQHSIEEVLLKPIPYYDDPDLRSLASCISRDICNYNTGVYWKDIVALDEPKRLLKEAVVLPVKYPELFTGILSPWCGILLYGPPGTGKTMLAKAVARECRTTFFNISASSIVSKYRGDSEKLVRVLFELARYHAPSTIFIDEIDAIMSQREGSEHEGSRRMKTELLIQMDGLAKGSELVFVLAASNLPWELDMALLRRLEKKVFVPLPDVKARESMLKCNLQSRTLQTSQGNETLNFKAIAMKTEGYSGADIRVLCKEAAMRPVRKLMQRLEAIDDLDVNGAQSTKKFSKTKLNYEMACDPVTFEDLEAALKMTAATTQKFSEKYDSWKKINGSM